MAIIPLKARVLLQVKLLLALLFCSFQSYAKKITIASDIWCPYICQDPKQPGYIVEMIDDILHKKNYRIKSETIPLARAIKYLQHGEVDIVLGLTQEHIESYNLIRTNVPVGNATSDFFVNHKNPWRFSTIEQLEAYGNAGYKIGIIKGYVYGPVLHKLITKKPEMFSYAHGDFPLQLLIKQLKSGRIDILLDSRNTVLNELKRADILHWQSPLKPSFYQ
jgi:polar amino acid transport system substrate-binding protein